MSGPIAKRSSSELTRARDRLLREVQEGLDHGFFEITLACELIKDGKRRLTIKAGKSHQFVIAEDELHC